MASANHRATPEESPGDRDRRFLVDAALALAARGRPVFPCRSNKAPATRAGFRDATIEPAAIRRLFAYDDAALVGVPTGPASGFVVVDIDTGKDGADGAVWLQEHAAALPVTRTHKTRSGGKHLLFLQPPDVDVVCSQSAVAPGVDVRGGGGYVIVPPSNGYSVETAAPLAPLPPWLLALVRKKEAPPPRQPRTPWDASNLAMDREAKRLAALLRTVAQARIGERHNKVFWVACRIAEAEGWGELPGDVAFAALRDAAAGLGLPPKEVEDAIRDARARACGGVRT